MIGYARTTIIGRVRAVQWAADYGMGQIEVPLKRRESVVYRVLFTGKDAQLKIKPGAPIFIEGSMIMDEGPAYLRAFKWRVVNV